MLFMMDENPNKLLLVLLFTKKILVSCLVGGAMSVVDHLTITGGNSSKRILYDIKWNQLVLLISPSSLVFVG